MRHLKRAGLLLLGVLLLVFVAPRVMPVPDFLLPFGFHAQQNNDDEKKWAALPLTYASSTTCNECHQKQYGSWQQAGHQTVSCENCHGPANDHKQTFAKPVVDTSPELCGLCHAKLASRPASFPQVDLSSHGEQKSCVTCHSPHDPFASMPPRIPHAQEGREDCQVCHNPVQPLVEVPPKVPHTLDNRTDCLACHGKGKSVSVPPPPVPHALPGYSDCLLCHNTSSLKPFPDDHKGRSRATCLSCHGSK